MEKVSWISIAKRCNVQLSKRKKRVVQVNYDIIAWLTSFFVFRYNKHQSDKIGFSIFKTIIWEMKLDPV